MRIAGSMVFILLLFILTAILVKVKMDQEHFFSITMATIWFINSMFLIILKFIIYVNYILRIFTFPFSHYNNRV